MATHYTRPVAAIRGNDGGIAGTGSLILGRFVLTCAHVVDDAVGRDRGAEAAPGARLTVDLPFLNRTGLQAKVVAWYPMRPLADLVRDPLSDLAVLELAVETEIAGGLRPEDVDRRPPAPGARFLTYGFPEGYDTGTQASGEVLVAVPGGWLQVRDTQDYGYFIKPGFSGAPVLSATTPGDSGDRPRLIGLAAQADRDEAVRLAFVLPAQLLCETWPRLARPYIGLFAFGEEEADLFFGREAFIAELVAKLEEHPFTAVVGPSGVGKSSVVLAGLVPRLRADAWRLAVCRPLRNPLRELAIGLVPLLEPGAGSLDAGERLAEDWTGRLVEDPGRILDLARGLGNRGGPGRTLLVIDQFEELFTADAAALDGAVARKEEVTREDGSPRQAAFLKVLEVIAGQDPRRAPIRAVATLRADFMGAALEIGRLARLLRDADVKLGPMTAAELSAAIRKPAERFGVGFEAGLVEEIVADMKGRPGGLPLLQFALDRLWQRQADRRLSLAAYRGADGKGGLETALDDHAETVLADLRRDRDLGADAEAQVRRLLLRLVRLGDGEGTPDARAVVRRADLRAEDWPLVERLAEERLVMISRDAVTGEKTAEVVHEALIGAWDRLRGWLNADRAFGLWRQRLKADLERWSGKPDDAFLRGGVLAEATSWLASHRDQLNDREGGLIEVSGINARREADQKLREAEERAALAAENQRRAEELADQERKARAQHKRINTWLRVTVVVLGMAVTLAGFGMFESQRQNRLAETATNRAEAAAAAQAEARAEAHKAARQALAAAERAETAAAAEKVARAEAEAAKLRAEAAAQQAEIERNAALVAAQEAKGRQLAVEAVGIQSDLSSPASANRATALAIEGWRRFPTPAAFRAASTALRELPTREIQHEGVVWDVGFSPDGTLLATASADNTARLIRVSDGIELARVEHGHTVTAVTFSPDGRLLATGSVDGTARLIHTSDGSELARVELRDTAWNFGADVGVAVAFSPDGTLLASTSPFDNSARLIRTSDGSELARIEHGGAVAAVAFSPDGALLLTGSNDDSARLIRTMDGSEVARIEHGSGVNAVAFSPDGNLLATGSFDGAARLIRTKDGSEVGRVEHGGPVSAVAFSLDGSLLVTGSEQIPGGGNSTARLIRTADGLETVRVEHGGSVHAVALSPDGALLATGSADSARLIRTNDGSEVARLEHVGGVLAVAFSPDGTLLATSSGIDNTARLMRTADDTVAARVEHGDWVVPVAFSPDGALLATGGSDGSTRLIRTADGSEVARVEHGGSVHAVAFSADGALLTTLSHTTARLIRARDGKEIARAEHGTSVDSVAFSPDGMLLAIASYETETVFDDGTVHVDDRTYGYNLRLIRITDGSEIARVEQSFFVYSVAFSPDGTLLAAVIDNTVQLMRTNDGGEIARVEHGDKVLVVAFSPDGALLATGSGSLIKDPGTARLIRTSDGSELARVDHGAPVNAVAFSPDGMLLATRDDNGTVRLIRTKDGSEAARVEYGGWVQAIAFSPDSTLLAATGIGNTARLIRTKDGSEAARVEHGGWVHAIAFSPDSALLATGSEDGSARLIRTADGSELARFEHGDLWVTDVAFSPDGASLVTGSGDDGSVRLWLAPDAIFTKLCRERAGRNLSAEEWIRHIGPIQDWAPTCPEWPSDSDQLAAWQARHQDAKVVEGKR